MAQSEPIINIRPSFDEYVMSLAYLIGQRSTCLRRKVGAVAIKDKRILTTGFNGASKGLKHCTEIGTCLRRELNVPSGQRHEICRGVHAEQNVIIQAAVFGVSIKDATVYITTFPCSVCVKMLINAGVREIIYDQYYDDELAQKLIEESSIPIRKFEKNTTLIDFYRKEPGLAKSSNVHKI